MASSFDKLPTDVLSHLLLLLPAKELCRHRTVCRSGRCLTSDAAFVRAHADRHKDDPLFLAKSRDDEAHVYVVDLSSDVVKRIAGGVDGSHQVQHTRPNLACLATECNRCCLLNPATGRIQVLLLIPSLYYVNGLFLRNPSTSFALGMVASTGEYKLLAPVHGLWLWPPGAGAYHLWCFKRLETKKRSGLLD